MTILEKPKKRVVLFGKFVFITILAIISGIIKFFSDKINDTSIIKDIFYQLYDNEIISYDTYDKIAEDQSNVLFCIILIFAVFYILKTIYNIIVLSKTEYIIDFDNKIVIIKEGWLSKTQDSIAFSNIVDIDMSQSIIENIFKTHSLLLFTKGDMSSNLGKNLTKSERATLNNINANIEHGYINLKKLEAITNAEKLLMELRKEKKDNI